MLINNRELKRGTCITVITINLNNSTGLQKTIQSVLSQTYKNIEYIVIDGGSTDDSVRVIEENKEHISYSISEPDSGVYNAMNKGIQKASGEYLLFLNSGDYFISESIVKTISKQINGIDIVYGNLKLVLPGGKFWIGVYPNKLSFCHFVTGSLPHPASFIKKSLFDKEGLYDENLKICGDWKFFLNAVVKHSATYMRIDQTIAVFHLDGISSGNGSELLIAQEKEQVISENYPSQLNSFLQFRNESIQHRKQKKLERIKKYLRDIFFYRS